MKDTPTDREYATERVFGPQLHALGPQFAIQCDKQNREYFKCKIGDENPQTCLKQAESVLECSENV